MAFIRTKKVKEWRYAYLVENKWRGKRARQKVKSYLGRVYTLDKPEQIDVELEINEKDYKQAVKDLVKFELMKKGFTGEGSVLTKGELSADLDHNRFHAKGKNIVLKMNDGHLCSHTFAALFDFRAYGEEEEGAVRLAEALVQAGLSIPEKVFISLYINKFKPELPTIGDTKSFI